MGQNATMAVEHFKRIADASDLPLIAFQYPLATGQGYPNETMLRMIEEIPTLKAIKDWAGTPQQHEWHVRTLQHLSRPFNVLSTQSSWLMSSLSFGCKGLLSGSGSVIADLQAQLFRAVQAGDLKTAQAINDRIYPLASVFYAQPWVDMHNRMKEALVLMGKLPRAVVRPPLVKIERTEVERIRKALVEARLLPAASARRRNITVIAGLDPAIHHRAKVTDPRVKPGGDERSLPPWQSIKDRFLLACVMGWPIYQSRSPMLHNFWFKQHDMAGSYVPLAVPPEDIHTALRALPALGFSGVNLTIPHKQTAMQDVEEIDNKGRGIGAINLVVVRPDGSLFGSNTDAYGFIANINQMQPEWRADAGPVVVIGAGGASRTAIWALVDRA